MENLTTLRKKAGFDTQQELADALGVKRAVVAKWETGDNYPRASILPQIAKLCHTTEGNVIAAVKTARAAKQEKAPA